MALVVLLGSAGGFGPDLQIIENDLSSEDPDHRERALEYLGDCGRPGLASHVASLANHATPLLGDPEPDVQGEAIKALGFLENWNTIPDLEEIVTDPSVDTDLGEDAFDAIADMKSPLSLPVALRAVQNPNPDIAHRARKSVQNLTVWLRQWEVTSPDDEILGQREELYPEIDLLRSLARDTRKAPN